jgi:hypothetical protein
MKNHRDEFPHVDFDGSRVLKELDYQADVNPAWSPAEKAWFGALRDLVKSSYCSYEDAIKQAEMQGIRNPAFDTDDYSDYEESA